MQNIDSCKVDKLILENTLTKKENNISIEATEGEVCKVSFHFTCQVFYFGLKQFSDHSNSQEIQIVLTLHIYTAIYSDI